MERIVLKRFVVDEVVTFSITGFTGVTLSRVSGGENEKEHITRHTGGEACAKD